MTPSEVLRDLSKKVGPSNAKALVASLYGDIAHFISLRYIRADELEDIFHITTRLLKGEPLQYVVGYCEFMSLRFKVTPSVLIPRPETEVLVEIVLKRASPDDIYFDLGTGSGAIAVSLSYYGRMFGYAVDISSSALEVARENAIINGVFEKIEFIHADSLTPLMVPEINERVTLIVSNPPYIPSPMLEELPQAVKHEPRMALDGGPDGLLHYKRIFGEFRDLIRGKRIFLEFAPYEAVHLEELLQKADVEKYEFLKGLDGEVRYLEVHA
ncbi:MAG: release factor glutamine methyltransferase [Thermotogota bacterium]|nr:release factor glutamine methyltransferase [Thermotogota bacterium]MDK2865267.1 release factor glutamine methyltransferase [Thermotogota bacterium]